MYSILIAGGDMRQVMLARLLEEKGHKVWMAGFEKMSILNKADSNPDFIFLPIPYKNEDGSVKAPFAGGRLNLYDIVNAYPDSAYLLGGCDAAAEKLFGTDIKYTDLMRNEAYQIRNALLTAQGAVCAYLNNTDAALCDRTCLVTGYGRISKFLCRLLNACSSEVITAARKDKDIELITLEGYRAVRIKDMKETLPEADVIFNTVPFHVFGNAEIACIKKGAKYIELASPPYGVNMDLANSMGVDVQMEPGVPGRFFPASAAKAILHAFEGEEK